MGELRGFMNIYEAAVMESKIESAQNEIRGLHNYLESRKIFGKKHYFPMNSTKFIKMINLFREDVKNILNGIKEKPKFIEKEFCHER